MHICFVLNNYPTKTYPIDAFIRPVVCGFADKGVKCTVLAPQSLSGILWNRIEKRARHWEDISKNGNTINIYQPFYLSISKVKLMNWNISTFFRDRAIRRVFRRIKIKPDIVYAHFWDCGIIASEISDGHSKTVVVSGESEIRVNNLYSIHQIENAKKNIDGLICVSAKNLEESIDLNLVSERIKTTVIPNAIDNTVFFKRDKSAVRNELGFNQDAFLVCFVGTFCHRKGVNRVLEAVKHVPSVQLILIGSGDPVEDNGQIVFKGQVPHEEIAKYLNAADIFVLPTLAEGCCNAIVEALSCGLPVVSSNRSFNKDILNDRNSILIDPLSIDEIADAIKCLYENKDICKKMSEEALKSANELTMDKRIENLYSFISQL